MRINFIERSTERRAAIWVKRPRNINTPILSSIIARYHTMNVGKGNRGSVNVLVSECLFLIWVTLKCIKIIAMHTRSAV